MKKNKGFTTPCYMVVKDGNHANRLMIALKILVTGKYMEYQKMSHILVFVGYPRTLYHSVN